MKCRITHFFVRKNISFDYTNSVRIPLALSLALLALSISCSKYANNNCSADENQLMNKVSFPCGVVADMDQLRFNVPYSNLVNSQFNSVTAENIMKPYLLHPTRETFSWRTADELANYCARNKKRLHGHTLIWHLQLPEWMNNFKGSKKDWEQMFKEHIQTIVGHFRGRVSSWDVVNEAFNEDGTLRNTIWKKHLGASYIEKAFIYAHEADPNAKLFYNDYSVIINPVKRKAILTYLNHLKKKGVPIHGIGLQAHIFNGFPENVEISNAINEVWKAGYLVHISELDISINPLSKTMEKAPEKELKRQAMKYLYIFRTFKRIPSKYQFGITIWGVSDQNSWIRYFYNRNDYPLLFDDNYNPKPAFCTLINNL